MSICVFRLVCLSNSKGDDHSMGWNMPLIHGLRRFTEFFKGMHSTSRYDPSMFLWCSSTGLSFFDCADNIISTGMIMRISNNFNTFLTHLSMGRTLGYSYILCLEVHTSEKWIFVNRHKYITRLIAMAWLQDSYPVNIPFEVNVKYSQKEGDLFDPTVY